MIQGQKLRSIPLADLPFWERHVTLGCVYEGEITFVQNKGEKNAVLEQALRSELEGALLFVAWTGQWTTDLFAVTRADIVHWLIKR